MEFSFTKIVSGAIGAALIPAAGFAYTTHTKCMEEANSAIYEYADVRAELEERVKYLTEAVDRSRNSVVELGKQIAPVRAYLSKFKDTRTNDLVYKENLLQVRFAPPFSVQSFLTQNLDEKSWSTLKSLLSGTVPTNITDRDLPALQNIILKFKNAIAAQGTFNAVPRCGTEDTILMMLGYKPVLVDKYAATTFPPAVAPAAPSR